MATINGDDGENTINGTSGDDTIDAGAGNDRVNAAGGNDSVDGGEGNDTLDGGFGSDTISGGDGNDTIDGAEDNDSISGDAGEDSISGSFGNDTIDGGEGNDTIDGGSDQDSITGGDGNDSARGSFGDDTVHGGSGDDTIDGGGDDDVLDGGADNDSIQGGFGDDTIEGGEGDDTIDGGSDQDSITGGDGNDSIFGSFGEDTVHGGSGDDTIDGGSENDVLHGGAGSDSIRGGFGDDTIEGGEGDDTLQGDDGADTFVIRDGQGNDEILDFATGEDLIAFDMAEINGFSDVQDRLSQDGSDTLITFDNGDTVRLRDVDPSNLSASNFAYSAGPVCLAAGTPVLTRKGNVPIETIKAGDEIWTLDHGWQPVILATREAMRFGLRDDPGKPVLIPAGALAPSVPGEDLIVSPQHRVLIIDPETGQEVLVAATKLRGTRGIRRMRGRDQVCYHNLVLRKHSIIKCADARLESMLLTPLSMARLKPLERALIGDLDHSFPARRILRVPPHGWAHGIDRLAS